MHSESQHHHSDFPSSSLNRTLEVIVQIFIVLSLISFTVETLPDISPTLRTWLNVFEAVSIAVFFAEYAARLWRTKHKLAFVFSFYGIVDLLAILSFFLSTELDLRPARAFRLFWLFWILKLGRYHKAVKRFQLALRLAREEIILFMILTLIVLYLAAVGIYYFERDAQPEHFKSVFHSLWWSITTLTTVGYGDVYPVTLGGRMFTFVVLLVGLGVVSVPAGLVSAALLRARTIEQEEADQHKQP